VRAQQRRQHRFQVRRHRHVLGVGAQYVVDEVSGDVGPRLKRREQILLCNYVVLHV
jgi:hypothetical protein